MDIPRITPRQVALRLAGGEDVVFLDSRSRAIRQHAALQIPGSVRASPERLDRLPRMPEEPVAVVYCTCPGEASSTQVVLRLRELGIEAYVLDGGFDAWVRAGLPAEPRAVVPELASQV